MKRVVVLVLALCLLSGCWDAVSLSQAKYSLMVGVDFADGEWTVTALSLEPEAEEGETAQLHESTGPSLARALAGLYPHQSRRMLGMLQCAFFSQSAAGEGLEDFVDLMLRDAQVPLNFGVAVCTGAPRELLEGLQTAPQVWAVQEALRRPLGPARAQASFFDLVRDSATPGNAPLLPLVDGEAQLVGAALFHGAALDTTFDEEKNKFLMMLRGTASNLQVVVPGGGSDLLAEVSLQRRMEEGEVVLAGTAALLHGPVEGAKGDIEKYLRGRCEGLLEELLKQGRGDALAVSGVTEAQVRVEVRMVERKEASGGRE